MTHRSNRSSRSSKRHETLDPSCNNCVYLAPFSTSNKPRPDRFECLPRPNPTLLVIPWSS